MDRPVPGKVYALTGDGTTPAISSGNTWAESEVLDHSFQRCGAGRLTSDGACHLVREGLGERALCHRETDDGLCQRPAAHHPEYCAVCGAKLTAAERARLDRDIDFVEHGDALGRHLIRRVS